MGAWEQPFSSIPFLSFRDFGFAKCCLYFACGLWRAFVASWAMVFQKP
jgi:hypothetical protein